MPIQAPQWTDFRLCPVCQNEYNQLQKPPISLGCGHSICQSCLFRLSKQQCPFDQAEIQVNITKLPINYALLSLVGGEIIENLHVDIPDVIEHERQFDVARDAIEILAQSLQNVVISGNSSSSNSYSTANGSLTRPMQRKLVTLIHSQLAEEEGRARAMRAARSIGERAVKELILMHQSPQTLSAALWAAVRQRGCQFLGPAMQDAVLKLILLSLEDGNSLSRKVLVLFVVQRLEKQFTQASKTSIGHVVQLLYRASCFKVTKRDGDSSLLQLHEKFRTYSALRKEHDAQIVQIAMEAGLHISPEQWSALLYGDDEHKSHMQSIIDKLQTPASFASSIQELIIALQRTDDPHDLQSLRIHLDRLSAIDPNPEADPPSWEDLEECMKSLLVVVSGLQTFAKDYAAKNKGNIEGAQMINTKYRTSMCRDILQRKVCPRGVNCNFAHSEEELERYRKRRHMPVNRISLTNGGISNGLHTGSRTGSSSSPDSCSNADLDEDLDIACCSAQNMNGNLSVAIPQQGNAMQQHFAPPVTDQSAISQDAEGVLSGKFKTLNILYNPTYHQQQIKKEEVIPPREVMKVPPSGYEVSVPPQQIQGRPNPYQVQFQPAYYDMARENGVPQSQQTMYLQSNQQPFVANGQVYHQPMQQVYSYHQEYPQYPIFANQPFTPVNFNMRTAIARGGTDSSDLLKSNATNELSLNIPSSSKDSKEDGWKFGSNKTVFNRIDSCLDSGRGSSIGYSSDTFSPLSSASAGSRGSPQSVQENDPRKLWEDNYKIWGAPSESSSLSTWSNNRTTSRGWDFFLDSRLSDHEEQNTSSESAGKCHDHQTSVLDEQSYSSMKDWSRSSDRINKDSQGLLGLFPPNSPATKRPPPGFSF